MLLLLTKLLLRRSKRLQLLQVASRRLLKRARRETQVETAPGRFFASLPPTKQDIASLNTLSTIVSPSCVAAKGEGAPECDKFAKYYPSLCPWEWAGHRACESVQDGIDRTASTTAAGVASNEWPGQRQELVWVNLRLGSIAVNYPTCERSYYFIQLSRNPRS
ncbi:hypothetical protein CRG98_044591 [Punica granatum]|uniref:Uncharacterized protein n=1 Tax=Punica granatum TaxID=22663 RepID=A0A2I0HUR2_PUNGR|nr:hypothetical protein CRG98_044591 [Punica granatum]